MMDTTDTERSPTIRLTAAERRDAIVDAAIHEFAVGAFGGTPGAATAPWGGVSQPSVAAAIDLPEAGS